MSIIAEKFKEADIDGVQLLAMVEDIETEDTMIWNHLEIREFPKKHKIKSYFERHLRSLAI